MAGKQRAYGSGHIEELQPGVFKLQASAGRDPVTGRRRRISETFHGGRRDAQRRLAELVAQHSATTAGTTATLGTLVERWLHVARIADSTKANYRNALRHVPDHLMNQPLTKITAHELDSLYASLRRGHLGIPTVRIAHAALSSALGQGVKWRWLSMNPAAFATPPTSSARRPDPPSGEELARILSAAVDDQTRLWLRLAILTGARRSEILAVRWQDIDWRNRRLEIAGALDIHRVRKETKTGEARRIALDDETMAALRGWQVKAKTRALAVGGQLTPDGYVLSDDPLSAVPWRPDLATSRFRKLAASLGLEGVHLHDLRHAHATQLMSSGVPIAAVAKRLGHKQIATTLNVYGHAMEADDERAAEVAAAALVSRKSAVGDP